MFEAFTLIQDVSRFNLGDAAIRAAILLVLYLAFILAQYFIVKNSILRSVGLQLNLLVLNLLVILCLKTVLIRMHPYVMASVNASAVFIGVLIGIRIADAILFDLIARWRNKPPVPKVVRDIVRWIISLFALVLIIRVFFPGVNLSVLAVSSIVAGYILGNATQDTLGNLISGLALNTETPFQIGDWVAVGGHIGRVENTTWRATSLRTKSDDHIIIPNASIGREPIINYSRPTRAHGCYCKFGVDYDSPPNKVRQVVRDVLDAIPQVLKKPLPQIYLSGYGDFSINYTIKLFIHDYAQLDEVQSLVMDRLWYAFKRVGIVIPFPIHDVRMRDVGTIELRTQNSQRKAVMALFSNIDLFKSMSEPELNRLADVSQSKPFAAGETLCKEGDPGDSFYIIQSGQVAVSVTGQDGGMVSVAHLGIGAFFGEMSLLTGEARSATVTAETDTEVCSVSKADFTGLLEANENLAVALAAVLEKRSLEQHAKKTTTSGTKPAPVSRSALTERIRKFFELH